MNKSIIKICVCLACAAFCLSAASAQTTPSDSFKWKIVDGGDEMPCAEIIGYAELLEYETDLLIPSEIRDLKVISVRGMNADMLMSIEMPDSVRNLDLGDCKWIRKLKLPKDLESVNLKGCLSLSEIDASENKAFFVKNGILYKRNSDGVEQDLEMCFVLKGSRSDLRSLEIPSSVASLAPDIFEYCEHLEELKAPITLYRAGRKVYGVSSDKIKWYLQISKGAKELTGKTIDEALNKVNASKGSLSSIVIPESIETVSPKAFDSMPLLSEIIVDERNNRFYFADGFLFEKLDGEEGGMKLRSILDQKKKTLKAYAIPEHVTSIGDWLFDGCESLASVSVPSSVVHIGENAFISCKSLWKLSIDKNNTKFFMDDGILFERLDADKGELKLRCVLDYRKKTLSDYHVPNHVAAISENAFSNCGSLTFIDIPESVSFVGNHAFDYCHSLKTLKAPIGLKGKTDFGEYGNKAVEWCLHVPDGTEKIEMNSLSGFLKGTDAYPDEISHVILPDSVVSIGDDSVFHVWGSLVSFWISKSVSSIGENAFNNCESLKKLVVDPGNKKFFVEDDGVLFERLADGGVKLHSFLECKQKNMSSYSIPDFVTEIGDSAFAYAKALRSITVPSSVKSIGNWSFEGCSNLSSIVIPSSVSSIGDSAFAGCARLNVTIPPSVESIGARAFESCSRVSVDKENRKYFVEKDILFEKLDKPHGMLRLHSVLSDSFCRSYSGRDYSYSVPDSVTEIADYAFSGRSTLKSIAIPPSVESIGSHAFERCSSLTSVAVPPLASSIGESAFDRCASLESVSLPDFLKSIGDKAFYDCGKLKSIEIPSSVESIGDWAFSFCRSLETVKIPSSAKSIGSNVFSRCSSLHTVELPDSLTAISAGLLYGCESIKSISIPSSVTSIGYDAFRGCSSLSSVELPDSVTTIGSGAFSDCNSLLSVVIPESVTKIGNSAFGGCRSLSSVRILGPITSIESHAFANCPGLAEINIPPAVDSIGWNAFRGCESLATIDIPDSVKRIDYGAFSRCSSLSSLVIPASVEVIGAHAFDGDWLLTGLSVARENKIFFYEDGFIFARSSDSKGVVKLHTILPHRKKKLEKYDIPRGVTVIGNEAFDGCEYLVSVSVPSTVNFISDTAFSNCPALESVAIDENNGIFHIEDGILFEKMEAGTVLDDGNSIESHFFALPANEGENKESLKLHSVIGLRKKSLEKYDIPRTVVAIGDHAFSGCSLLSSVSIPSSVVFIGDYAFSECSSLASPSFPDSLAYIGNWAFSGCKKISYVSIPKSVRHLGNSAFYGCDSIRSLRVPKALRYNLGVSDGVLNAY